MKLIFPKFRVGDIVRHIPDEKWNKKTKRISYIGETGYNFDYKHLGDNVSGGSFGFVFEKNYELVEQKPAEWSEEDESRLVSIENSLSDYLDYVREDNSLTKHQKKSTKGGVLEHVNWLKSLRPQKQWKPSTEQIN